MNSRPLPQPTALPVPLALQPPEAVPVNHRLSLLFDGDLVVYFVFTVPFASHRADDTRARNRCLAQCALVQMATLAELARAFGLSTGSQSGRANRLIDSRTLARRIARSTVSAVTPILCQRAARRSSARTGPALTPVQGTAA